jgi:uncharacterized membrane protein
MIILSALLALTYVGLFVKGVRRRRHAWSRQSWWHFGIALVASLVALAGGVLLARMADAGLRYGRTVSGRELSYLGLLAISSAAVFASVSLLGWFATGEPDGQPWWPLGSRRHAPNN